MVYLNGPTDPILVKIKKGILKDRNSYLHFVLYELQTTKFEMNLFNDITFRKLTLLKEFHN